MSATSGKEFLTNAVAKSDLNMGGFRLLNLDDSNLNISLPSQSTNSGKFLKTDGTIASWGTAVTSVGLSTNASWLTVGSSPIITSTGTLTLNATAGLAQNLVVATPDGTTGAVSLRALVSGDIPPLSTAKLTSGTLPLARGGTGISGSGLIAGDLIYYSSGAGTFAGFSGVASGNALISAGTGVPPLWGKITSAHVNSTILIAANNLSDVTTKATAQNNLLPTQATNSGKYLTTDGTNVSWSTVAGSGSFTAFTFTNGGGFVGTVANGTTAPNLQLTLGDSSDNTKTASFDCSNIATGTNRVVNVPNANSTTAQTNAGASHNFLTAMSSQGVFSKAQPAVADISDFNASIAPAFTALTDGATVTLTAVATTAIQNRTLTIGGNRSLAFSGVADGMSGIIVVTQDGSGGHSLVLPATSKVINNGSGAVTLTSAAAGIDVLGWVKTSGAILWTILSNFS